MICLAQHFLQSNDKENKNTRAIIVYISFMNKLKVLGLRASKLALLAKNL